MQQPETSCPFCQADSNSHEYLLEETDSFRVAADQHPLTEGHVLIIPKGHVSCVGEYGDVLMDEFLPLYKKVQDFVQANYGPRATFEHGKLGQSVFHSHVHILPFNGSADEIVPEGESHLASVGGIKDVQTIFEKQGRYLFFSINNESWVVDPVLGFPRFFRDRFANALGVPERGDWKQMHEDPVAMAVAEKENRNVKDAWKRFFVL